MNRLEHGRKELIAVLKQLDFVSRLRHRISQGQRRSEKLGGADGKGVLEFIFERFAPDEEKAKDDDERDKDTESRPERGSTGWFAKKINREDTPRQIVWALPPLRL
jgi:hypothetical protein